MGIVSSQSFRRYKNLVTCTEVGLTCGFNAGARGADSSTRPLNLNEPNDWHHQVRVFCKVEIRSVEDGSKPIAMCPTRKNLFAGMSCFSLGESHFTSGVLYSFI